VRKKLFRKTDAVIRLVNEKHIPFAEIVALSSVERLKLFKLFMPVYDVDLGQFDDLTFEKLVVLTSEQLASLSPEKSLRLPSESLRRLSYNKLFNLFVSLKDKEFPDTPSPPSSIYNPGMF